jgi:tripartite-type tricarboxylate transporter receptor subunit TctC
MTVVPSTGGTNEAIREIMGGRGHAVIEALPGLVRSALDAGDLKALAIMTRARVPTALDIPTAAEIVPGLTAVGWTALFAPKGTPQAIVQQLSEDLRKAQGDPDVEPTAATSARRCWPVRRRPPGVRGVGGSRSALCLARRAECTRHLTGQ